MTEAPHPLAGPVEIALDGTPTILYRLYDADWGLLYIGITDNLSSRLAGHRREQDWWPQVSHIKVALYAYREDAAHVEDMAILAEHPVHNKKGGQKAYDRLRKRQPPAIGPQPLWERRQGITKLPWSAIPPEYWDL